MSNETTIVCPIPYYNIATVLPRYFITIESQRQRMGIRRLTARYWEKQDVVNPPNYLNSSGLIHYRHPITPPSLSPDPPPSPLPPEEVDQ
jgi:hypothetical protein